MSLKSVLPDHYVADDGVVFRRLPDEEGSIHTIRDYRADDIRLEDHVVDIGANVGAFCIRASRYAGRVLAVEPVLAGALRENIRCNGVDVKVLEGGLGDGGARRITWGGHPVTVRTYTLREIITIAGGCDFLKCDCEGAEWSIRPADLAGVRRIEMELHIPPIGEAPNRTFLEYIGEHYVFEIERKPCHDVLGVMGILHAHHKDIE
jgi:hypothetical protein